MLESLLAARPFSRQPSTLLKLHDGKGPRGFLFSRVAHLASFAVAHPAQVARELPAALWNRARGRNPMADELPWMPFAAIEFLKKEIKGGARVLEFGSGGSTLFLARRAAQVVTVEHDEAWAERVRAALSERRIDNVDFRCVPPRPGGEPGFASELEAYRGLSFVEYVGVLSEFPEGHFDAVIVDGRVRNACVRAAVSRVRRGGVVVLDNSDRDRYAPSIGAMAAYSRTDFTGLNPYQPDPGRTSVWRVR